MTSDIKVLVVEDEWPVRQVLVDELKAANYEVVEASNGETALALLAEDDGIDVILTDIRLGGAVNGWDLGEALRATHPDAGVIYVSGAMISPPRQVPGSLFFDKPYDPAKLASACRSLCYGR